MNERASYGNAFELHTVIQVFLHDCKAEVSKEHGMRMNETRAHIMKLLKKIKKETPKVEPPIRVHLKKKEKHAPGPFYWQETQ